MPPYIRSVTAGAPSALVRVPRQTVTVHPPGPKRDPNGRLPVTGKTSTYTVQRTPRPVVGHPPKPLRDYRRANTTSLGATAIEYGTIPVSPPPKKRARARLAASLRGTSLGDDTLGADSADLLQQLVDSQKRTEAAQQRWFEGDLFWKRLGVIATVMIPVSAAVWRRFGIGRRPKPTP